MVRSNADQGHGPRWRLDPKIIVGALLLNGAWGLGVALLMRLLNRVVFQSNFNQDALSLSKEGVNIMSKVAPQNPADASWFQNQRVTTLGYEKV